LDCRGRRGCGAVVSAVAAAVALISRRLLAWTLRDLRHLAIGTQRPREDWEGRMYSRLAVLPDEAEPLQRAQLVAALSLGTEIIHLRRIVPRLGFGAELHSALADFARPNIAATMTRFAELDQQIESSSPRCWGDDDSICGTRSAAHF